MVIERLPRRRKSFSENTTPHHGVRAILPFGANLGLIDELGRNQDHWPAERPLRIGTESVSARN